MTARDKAATIDLGMTPTRPSRLAIVQIPDASDAPALESGSLILLPAKAYATRYTPKIPVVGFAFDAQEGEHAFGSDRLRRFRARPNSTAYTPAGCELVSRSPSGGEYLLIGLRQDESALPDRPFTDRVDGRAIAAARRLRRYLLGGSPTETLEIEREVMALYAGVAGTNAAGPIGSERWMTARRLKVIEDMIEADLAAQFSVVSLARRLGLSAGFFSRAFKAATGTTPHDYIIDRRLARARRLIAGTKRDLADIALSTGFASQAHLTAQMRQRLGITPGALRQHR